MRLYAVADIHGQSKRLAMIRDNLARCRADVLVVAGDIAGWKTGLATLEDLNALGVKVMAVWGNSDRPGLEARFGEFPQIVSLHLKSMACNDCHFTGAGGTIPLPFCSRIGFCENRRIKALSCLARPESVVVVHPPPRGTLDRVLGRWPAGSPGLAAFVRQVQPALLICGHIHDQAGVARIGRTVVVNATIGGKAQGAVIDVAEGEVLSVEMLPAPL